MVLCHVPREFTHVQKSNDIMRKQYSHPVLATSTTLMTSTAS